MLTAWYRKTTAGIQMWEARDTKTLNGLYSNYFKCIFIRNTSAKKNKN